MKINAKRHCSQISGSALFIAFGVISETENVVDGHIVVKGKFDKNIGRNVAIAKLVVAVGSLRTG